MKTWIEKVLADDVNVSEKKKGVYRKVLAWYLGYCSKNELLHPSERENGKAFWRNGVLAKDLEGWKRVETGDALKWFFTMVEEQDKPGRQMRVAIRRNHLRYRTEQTYMGWLRRFQAFLHPKGVMDAEESDVVRYLTHLAVSERVVSSTQNQAFNALLFFFRKVKGVEEVAFDGSRRARSSKRMPVVLTQTEVKLLIGAMPEEWRLLARLQYGAGLRVSELFRLRVHPMR
ncbi:MAG: site-specific integrase [Opitutales bacterium]|nr:site-specific integrase [Opitutales bacterium]